MRSATFVGRHDAAPVRNLHVMRRFMPYISPRRNDSVFHMAQEIEVEAAFEFLEKKNVGRPPGRRMTLFHLFLRSLSQAFELRPGVSRFVKGARLWQREGVYLTLGARRDIEDGSTMLTVKRRFEPRTETLEEMVDDVLDRLEAGRSVRKSTSENQMSLLLRLPGFAIRPALWTLNRMDALGLVPRGMIEGDPRYCSCFVADFGSVGMGTGFHHLWEYGTCSIFAVFGKVDRARDGRRFITICWTYDERIEDGLYSQITLEGIKDRLENPELLEAPTDELGTG